MVIQSMMLSRSSSRPTIRTRIKSDGMRILEASFSPHPSRHCGYGDGPRCTTISDGAHASQGRANETGASTMWNTFASEKSCASGRALACSRCSRSHVHLMFEIRGGGGLAKIGQQKGRLRGFSTMYYRNLDGNHPYVLQI